MVRTCLDWTERRHHLAGRAADAMLHTMLDKQWIARDETARSIRVTPTGERELFDLFGLPTKRSSNK